MTPVYPNTARVRDSVTAVRLPLLQLPEAYRKRSLPAVVDNSQNTCWPGIQDQYLFYTCQQYCGVSYVFGYEINRLRNLPGWYYEYYYPAHYTWNFMNQGERYTGVNFLQSFEVLKQQGQMTSMYYGEDTSTSVLGWVSGYENYYSGMFNHLKQVSAIKVNSAEGINTLRNYLFDHLNGSTTGGIACFTTDSYTLVNMFRLKPGTPEAGKEVVTFWYPDPVHGMTLVGYNDSIRFDLNHDGQFTNHLDINGDGVVDALDWEIGAFTIANSYGHWWSNDGFVYALYSSFARNYTEGGVWNNRVYVVDADTTYKPLLTLKVRLNYNSRNRIRILAGVSSDTLHQMPDHVIDFPIFNFQGGDHVMQGVDSDPEAKTIEFGLDVTPLLNFVAADEPARYFLMVEERDPDHLGQGTIQQASFINYQNGIHEFKANQEEVVIEDNNVTIVSAVGTMAKPHVQITTNSLPPLVPAQSYQVQLAATGGKPPYDWSFLENYTRLPSQGAMPLIAGTSIQVHQEFKSYVGVALPFSFPFYGKQFDSIYVNDYGFITFEPQSLPEPYVTDEMNMLETFASITPSFSQNYTYQANKNDGIWYQADASRAIIRWKVSVERYVTSSVDDFALILYPDGQFEFRYGTMDNQGFQHMFYSGVSKGDEQNFNLDTQWNANDVSGKSFSFLPPLLPTGMILSKEGLLEITAADSNRIYELPVMVADAGKITDAKDLMLSGGLEIEQQLKCGSGNRLQFGCQANMKLVLTNTGFSPIQNLTLSIRPVDSLLQITDSLITVALLQPGIPKTIEGAFSFGLKTRLPDNFPVRLSIRAQAGQRIWKKELMFAVAGHNLVIASPRVWDGDNNMLDPGEVAELLVKVENSGALGGHNFNLKLISSDTLVSILSENSIQIDQVDPYSKTDYHFQIAASRKTQGGYQAPMEVQLTDSAGILISTNFNLTVGKKPVALVNLAASRTSFLAMVRELDSLRIGYDTLFELPFEYSRYQCIFLILGNSAQGSHTLTVDEAATLAGYLGIGGHLYMEGYHTWYYLNKTPLHPWFKYTSAKIPVYSYPETSGIPGTLAGSMTFGYTGTLNSANFSFLPADAAYATLVNSDTPPKNLEIVYDGTDYKTIGTFLDFGGLNGTSGSSRKILMQHYLEFFGLNTTGPFPFFHATQTTVCRNKSLGFTDDSFDNIISRSWEFEGGTPATSNEVNPSVVYTQAGTFDVKLTVSDGTNSRSVLKKNFITVENCTGIGESPASSLFRVFPNPATDKVSIVFDQKIRGNCKIILFDLAGSRMKEIRLVIPSDNRFIIDLSGYAKGMYFLRVQAGESVSTQKVILN